MAVKAASLLLISLLGLSPQLALSDHHGSMIEVMCINATHHAVLMHGHGMDDEDEDDMNMSESMRRMAGHESE
eukprot:106307-Amphidinium_carterae.1